MYDKRLDRGAKPFDLKSRKSFVNVSVDKEFLYGILMLGSILDIRKGYKYETEFQF